MTNKNLKVVLFVSRNKDNKLLVGFKERKKNFLTTKEPEELQKEFNAFVNDGLVGEVSRFYISVNSRDNEKIQQSLQHYLLDNNVDMSKIDSKIASIAAKQENALEHKWLFDCDFKDMLEMDRFKWEIIRKYLPEGNFLIKETLNGYALVVHQGFDTRELLAKYPDVELKRDAMLLFDWKVKND